MAEPFAGRTALVLGVRFAGRAAALALRAAGARVLLADRGEVDLTGLDDLPFLGDVPALPPGVDLLWVAPGVAPAHPLVRAAQAAHVEVLGEAELAWRLRPADAAAPWLVVTGTNGKTTTVRMLEAMLLAAGRRAAAVGNVGVSLIDAVGAPYDVLAVELSSFQLHFAPSMLPAAGAVLNIAPDHLDWHGSLDAYATAKTRAWRGAVAVGNRDDPPSAARFAAGVPGRRVGFTLGPPGPDDLGLDGGMLVDRAFGGGVLFDAAEVRPSGAHNVANALAAAALARAAGIPGADVAAGLRAFVPDPHRNQHVAERGGVTWVDDSKATNPAAAWASLSTYPRVVWIAGGQLKDAPVDDLVRDAAPRLAGAVLLGADRGAIAAAIARHAPGLPVIDVARTDDGAMAEVVAAAAGLARPGDTVLLAPAAASYDMFAGYAARGEAFAAALAAL